MAARTRHRTIEELRREKYSTLRTARSVSDQAYNAFRRDPKLQGFYNSTRWKKLRTTKLTSEPICERCTALGRVRPAAQVHHVKKLATHWELRYVRSNLMSVCTACHGALEAAAE